MANVDAITAWGKPTIKTGPTGANDALGTNLTDVGFIKEDSTTVELQKGDVKENYGEGHELVDRKEFEGKWVLKFTLIKVSLAKLAELFGLELKDGKLPMTTTTVSEYRSYVVEPELVGTISAQMPKAFTAITPKFATNEGWTVEIEATGLQPADGSAPCTLYPKAAPAPAE